MSDNISRADAIEAVEHIMRRDKLYLPLNYKERRKALVNAITMIKKCPSTEAKWIPVSERLPNTNGIYIVTRRRSDGFECRNLTDACYFDGTSTWHDDTRVNHERKYLTDVLAWMPLPEPYKKEDE